MKSMILSVTTLFLFSGCVERTVYIKAECPKLQTYDVNRTAEVQYEIR